ncbi:hypothetical protein KBC70_01195, partial [Candidatus Woesebacteria bacterium]|nr:hypothetical protein [Candidatus Woesebacteria bacterium]
MNHDHIAGLSSSQVHQLQEKFGLNSFQSVKRKTPFEHFFTQFASPLIYILIGAGIITFLLKDYTDSIVIFLAVFVNTSLGFYQELKAEGALHALRSMISPQARVIRDSKERMIDAAELVPGDHV